MPIEIGVGDDADSSDSVYGLSSKHTCTHGVALTTCFDNTCQLVHSPYIYSTHLSWTATSALSHK